MGGKGSGRKKKGEEQIITKESEEQKDNDTSY